MIAGAGNVGRYVARKLEERGEGIAVRLIESNRNVAQLAAESMHNAIVVYGDVLQEEIMREVDVRDAQMFLALTNDDETNILSCVLASELGCHANFALVNQPQYPRFARRLGVDAFINPRTVTVSKVLRHVRRGRIRGVYSLFDGSAELLEAEALETSTLVGKPLREYETGPGIRIGAIVRGGKVIMPSGETRIEVGGFRDRHGVVRAGAPGRTDVPRQYRFLLISGTGCAVRTSFLRGLVVGLNLPSLPVERPARMIISPKSVENAQRYAPCRNFDATVA